LSVSSQAIVQGADERPMSGSGGGCGILAVRRLTWPVNGLIVAAQQD
jgi:hypothetical protein